MTTKPSLLPVSGGFLIALLLPVLVLALALGWMGNESLFLWINTHLTPTLGPAAFYFSLLGEAWGMTLLLASSLRLPFRYTLMVGLTWLLGACYSWLFKLWLLRGLPRPMKVFTEAGIKLNTVEGVKVHHLNSFPSGHTLTAYSVAFMAVVVFPKLPDWARLSLVVGAAACGFSRLLLAQHWPADVVGGACLGMAAAWSAWRLSRFMPENEVRLNTPIRDWWTKAQV